MLQLRKKSGTVPRKKKCSKNYRTMYFTQHNNGSSVTQKEKAKWGYHFEMMVKHSRDLAWHSHKNSATVPLRERIEKRGKLWEWVINDSKGSNEIGCPLKNNVKTLSECFVKVTQEVWRSFNEKMNENYRKMCDSSHKLMTRMGHQCLKRK